MERKSQLILFFVFYYNNFNIFFFAGYYYSFSITYTNCNQFFTKNSTHINITFH